MIEKTQLCCGAWKNRKGKQSIFRPAAEQEISVAGKVYLILLGLYD